MQGTKRWFVVLSLLLVLARLAGPVRAQSCEWARGFELAGIDGYVYALTGFADSSGPALYAGGSFTAAGGAVANRIAKWDGQQWSALGSGMNNEVRALTGFDDGSGPALYAGGFFTTAGGVGPTRSPSGAVPGLRSVIPRGRILTCSGHRITSWCRWQSWASSTRTTTR